MPNLPYKLLSKKELIKNKKLTHPKYFKNFHENYTGICLCILINDLKYNPKNPNEYEYSIVDIKIIPYENLYAFLNKNKNQMSHYIYKKWELDPTPPEKWHRANWDNLLNWEHIESLFISLKLNLENPSYIHPKQLRCWKTESYLKNNFPITKYDLNNFINQMPNSKIRVGDIEFYHFYSFLCYANLAPKKLYDDYFEWINKYYKNINSAKQ
jgi:hypothetical protein